MAELEPGHPDELVRILTNWLNASQLPEGKLLPERIDPVEWAVRSFISAWKGPVRVAIESVEECLQNAMKLCDAGAEQATIKSELDTARQIIGDHLRDELGLYDWNKE